MTSIRQRLSTTVACLGLGLLAISACDGEDEGGDPIAETGGEQDTTETGAEGDGDGDPETGGETTGELMGCALIDSADTCQSEPGCGPIMGNLLVDDGDGGLCTEAEQQFIGCANTSELCPPLPKTLCEGETVWRTTGCVPDNLTPCEAPAEISGSC